MLSDTLVFRIEQGLHHALDVTRGASLALVSIVERRDAQIVTWTLSDYMNRRFGGHIMRFEFSILLRGDDVLNVGVRSGKRLSFREGGLTFRRDLAPDVVRSFRDEVLAVARHASSSANPSPEWLDSSKRNYVLNRW